MNRYRSAVLALAAGAAAVSLAACSVGITTNIPGTPRPGGTGHGYKGTIGAGTMLAYPSACTGGAFGQDFVTITITPS